MKTTELATGFAVRLLDSGLTGTVGRYLDLVSASREPDQRKMTIATSGSGERRLFVSYISEAPVWKATYRIVLPSKTGQRPLLQGWAIVDNTGAQDWNNVDLSLVAGAPQSFVQRLSQPYYLRRPVVPIKESLSAAPQTFEAPINLSGARLSGTVRDASGAVVAGAQVKAFDASGGAVGEGVTDGQGRFALYSLPDGSMRLEAQSPGFRKAVQFAVLSAGQSVERDIQLQVGSTSETVEVSASAGVLNTESASVAARGRAGSGRALGSGAGLGRGGVVGGVPGGVAGGVASGLIGLDDARARSEAAARAQELGDLFEYKLKGPITIRKSQSALVPIIQANVTAEKVSIWNDQAGVPKPQRALWLDNSSGSTLDGGSFSVLESETFVGEGIFDSIRPGERRLISYAVDLAVTPDTKLGATSQRVTRASVSRGVFTLVREELASKTYAFHNADSSARTLLIEHPARTGYELRGGLKPVETSSGWMRFRLAVPAQQTSSITVEEARSIQTTYRVSNLTGDQVQMFMRERSVDKPLEEAFRKVLSQKAIVAGFDSEKEARNDETTKIYDDQQRLRENIKALKGSAEEKALLLRYTRQLSDQESRLDQLKKEVEELEAKQTAAQEELDKMIQAMAFDIKL